MFVLQHLVPVVDEIDRYCKTTGCRRQQTRNSRSPPRYYDSLFVTGLPRSIVIWKYQPNQYTVLWFTERVYVGCDLFIESIITNTILLRGVQ